MPSLLTRERIEAALGLPDNWRNDAAKAFVPPQGRLEAWRSLPNLEILAAEARTRFAMKCAAARTEEDASDIRVLARELGLVSSEQALRIVQTYDPGGTTARAVPSARRRLSRRSSSGPNCRFHCRLFWQ